MTFPVCGAHLPQNVSTRGLLFFTESSLHFFLCLFLLSCSPHLSHNMRREVLLGWSERRKLSPHLNRVYSFPCYSGVICFGDADRRHTAREVHGHPCWHISTSAVFLFWAAPPPLLCCFSRPLAPLASDLSSSLRPGCTAVRDNARLVEF